jgi:hypothetical protein
VSLLAKLDQVVTDLGFGQYTTTAAGSTLNMFFYTVSLMIGTAGLPHVIVRFFTVPKVADARSSAGWALVFIALLYTTAPAVGAMARLNLIGTTNTAVGITQNASGQMVVKADVVKANGDLFAPEASLKYDERPEWMKRWEKTGLLKFEDKNGDGRIQFYNERPRTKPSGQGRSRWLEGQRADRERRHHRAGQPGNRAAAQLGDRAGGCRWSGRCAVHRCRSAAGHLVGHFARPDQGRHQSQHQREERADGRQDLPWRLRSSWRAGWV